MSEPLIIVGAGGFGRETADVVAAINAAADAPVWNLVGIVDDAPSASNLVRLEGRGIKLLGTIDDLVGSEQRSRYVIGIGSPQVRKSIAQRLDAAGFKAAILVHPDASIGSECALGEGTVILAGARVTTNVGLGRHVHLNPNVTIGHDSVLSDFVSMNPSSSVSGDCVIGDGTLIGVGAVILNGVSIGAESVVGASACVVRNVPHGLIVKGVPAR